MRFEVPDFRYSLDQRFCTIKSSLRSDPFYPMPWVSGACMQRGGGGHSYEKNALGFHNIEHNNTMNFQIWPEEIFDIQEHISKLKKALEELAHYMYKILAIALELEVTFNSS